MKKILFVLSSEKLSGGEKIALEIAKNLYKEFEFNFYLPNQPQKEFEEEIKTFNYFYPNKTNFLNIIKNLSDLIKKENFDILHSHGIRATFYSKLAISLSFKKIKHIYTLHGIHFIHYRFPKNLLFIIFEFITNRLFVDYLVCVGKDDFKLAKNLKLLNEQRIFLIENGIKVEEYENYQKGSIKKEFNFDDEVIITTICRLHYQKDVETLIKAMKILEKEKIILLIVGDGPDREKLKKLVEDLNLSKKVLFLGFRKNIKEILADTDIFVLSTRWEGLPVVILEAWAMKKPVIASNVHGIEGLIKDGFNGLLFKLGDEFNLSKNIYKLIEDKKIQSYLGLNGYKTLLSNYTSDNMVRRYETIYLRTY